MTARAWWVAAAMVVATGCASSASEGLDGGRPVDAGPSCTQGVIQDCDCYNGIGRETCDQSGHWGTCDCRAGVVRPFPDAGPLPDAGAPDAGNQACLDACVTAQTDCDNHCNPNCVSSICNVYPCGPGGPCDQACGEQVNNCTTDCENRCASTAQSCESGC